MMATIIGIISACICFVSAIATLFYVNAASNTKRGLQWLAVMFITLVITYITIPFR